MEYIYDDKKKSECWYKNICDKSKCKDFCMRHYKMDFLVNSSMLVGKQQYSIELKPSVEDYQSFVDLRNIKNNINEFVTSGKNLLIYSKFTGNGKTEWSKKLLLSWLDSIWTTTDFECRALFVSMPKFILAMKENISRHNDYFTYINDNISKADLIIWDEINFKDWTSFEQDYMLNAISDRISIGKSNIYTTNYDLSTIENKLGTRLASRIIGCSTHIEFKGKDQRGVVNDK